MHLITLRYYIDKTYPDNLSLWCCDRELGNELKPQALGRCKK
ncbi:MAG: hypothetical protein WCF90_02185 [Methanomicrobiales archaeon]